MPLSSPPPHSPIRSGQGFPLASESQRSFLLYLGWPELVVLSWNTPHFKTWPFSYNSWGGGSNCSLLKIAEVKTSAPWSNGTHVWGWGEHIFSVCLRFFYSLLAEFDPCTGTEFIFYLHILCVRHFQMTSTFVTVTLWPSDPFTGQVFYKHLFCSKVYPSKITWGYEYLPRLICSYRETLELFNLNTT